MHIALRFAMHHVAPLNLEVVDGALHALARQALEAGDVEGFLCKASGSNALPLLIDNTGRLKAAGLYEAGLALAWTTAKHTNCNIDLELQKALFEFADRAKLWACGTPWPYGDGPVTLYRGVAGVEPDRRERGLAWTLARDRALWFACWQAPYYGAPAVLTCRVKRQHLYLYTQERQEEECVVLLPGGVKITSTPVTEGELRAFAAPPA